MCNLVEIFWHNTVLNSHLPKALLITINIQCRYMYSALKKLYDNLQNLQNLNILGIQFISCNKTNFQQKMMLGNKQYGSEIRPHETWDLAWNSPTHSCT